MDIFAAIEDERQLGLFHLGLPYIRMGYDAQFGQILLRDQSVRAIEEEYCATFVHEYVHFLQSVLFRSCQIRALAWHHLIFSIYQTAIDHKGRGLDSLLPIDFSGDCLSFWEKNKEIFSKPTTITLRNGGNYQFRCRDVAEGMARLLEEAYRGKSICDCQPPYTTIHDVNVGIFGEQNKLSNAELLDVAEIALAREYPGDAFVKLCAELRHSYINRGDRAIFFEGVEKTANAIGLKREGSFASLISKNVAGIFTSSIFEGYSYTMQSLYGKIPSCILNKRPIFSTLYEHMLRRREVGLPLWLIKLIREWDNCTPLIVNSRGEIEQFSPHQVSLIDQHALVVESVVRCIMSKNFGGNGAGCEMMLACREANGKGARLPVNSICKSNPWVKVLLAREFCCPFGAVRRAFGLDGLKL